MLRITSILAVALAILQPTLAVAQSGCVGDGDRNGDVTIHELVTAVKNALQGCAEQPVVIRFQGDVGDEPFA